MLLSRHRGVGGTCAAAASPADGHTCGEISPSRPVGCFDCDEQCDVVPDWVKSPITGEVRGFYWCGHEEHGGRLSCPPDDARQWELDQ